MAEGDGVRITDLCKSFGATEAVAGVSMEIRAGEIFGLLGPNGAGKTTTLAMLSTLIEPSGGDAEIFGASLRGDAARVKRMVGLAPQQISLYPELSAEENLHFFGRLHGVLGAELRRRSTTRTCRPSARSIGTNTPPTKPEAPVTTVRLKRPGPPRPRPGPLR